MNEPTSSLPAYFLQTPQWMNFWKAASGTGHNIHHFQNKHFSAWVQEYPLISKYKFWYIPKGPIIEKGEEKGNWNLFIKDIISAAKKKGIVFVKIDFDDEFTRVYGVEKLFDELVEKTITNSKSIQYLTSYTLAITPDFWSNVNEQVKRYTKKAGKLLNEKQYYINSEKSDFNFESFWAIHEDTTKRQQFSTQSKQYLRAMFDAEFSRCFVVYNTETNIPCSVWLGVYLNDTYYYILGGNSEFGMKNRTQYILQKYVIDELIQKNIPYYDMGGYEVGTGYSQFKDGFKGKIRHFQGPVDIVIDNNFYTATQVIKNVKKVTKTLWQRLSGK
jgi:lipid II:glycine glycyltransferase (peptidoglycan interpeptide bridge formation enzyme)